MPENLKLLSNIRIDSLTVIQKPISSEYMRQIRVGSINRIKLLLKS
jgi:hypothetical protein